MIKSLGYAAATAQSVLAPFNFQRRAPQPQDVVLEILYCGVCHSDVHVARSEWGASRYPCVPGHEVVGRVLQVGGAVSRFKAGDLAAVGCMVDSCRVCANCREGEEQFCEKGPVMTYGGPERHTGGITYGGYSNNIIVDEAYVLSVPVSLDPAAAAPLLCAGITTYSPLRQWKVGPGQRVGIVGLGGLGHMAVKFARAFGAHVVLFTTSPGKVEDGKRLGAHEVVVSGNRDEMKRYRNSFDFILDTVSAPHDINAYLGLLRRDGTLCQVGLPPEPLAVSAFSLTGLRRRLAGSFIGGIAETQEMLEFCAQHGIACDIELIAIQDINAAFERLVKGDVKYRFVIDMASLARDAG
ncbi:MAG: NAD(P)-dependent alcohol dehydrogenase [Moraxellaceae bacterium]|jgi:uncharacterized zinc-type alcohol dehydrogenase-like protein|nr:NAD(P)-dependent alcohol dehydrogenase [Moraxellaceae bacterium]